MVLNELCSLDLITKIFIRVLQITTAFLLVLVYNKSLTCSVGNLAIQAYLLQSWIYGYWTLPDMPRNMTSDIQSYVDTDVKRIRSIFVSPAPRLHHVQAPRLLTWLNYRMRVAVAMACNCKTHMRNQIDVYLL